MTQIYLSSTRGLHGDSGVLTVSRVKASKRSLDVRRILPGEGDDVGFSFLTRRC